MKQSKKLMTDKELHNQTKPLFSCKDYLVSGERYTLKKNQDFDMLVTSPIPSNLDKYYDSNEYVSHNNSKITGLNILYNIIKKWSFKRKIALFSKKPTQQAVLDIGAGTGDFLLYCKKNGMNVSGVEPNENARKKALIKGIQLQPSINTIPNHKFDVITLWHSLEHIPNLYECINQLKNGLAKDGQMFVAVPNFKSFDANYYKEFWAAYDVPRHLWHFSQQSIHLIFESVEMKVTKIHPLKFDSFYVSLLSEKHKTGTMNFIKAFLIGLRSNTKAIHTREFSSLIYQIEHK